MLYYIHTENTPVSNANGAAYLAKQAALPSTEQQKHDHEAGQLHLRRDRFD